MCAFVDDQTSMDLILGIFIILMWSYLSFLDWKFKWVFKFFIIGLCGLIGRENVEATSSGCIWWWETVREHQ